MMDAARHTICWHTVRGLLMVAAALAASVWGATGGYQILASDPDAPREYYTPGGLHPFPLMVEVDRMENVPPISSEAVGHVRLHLMPLGADVIFLEDEVLPVSVPLDRVDAERLLARSRGHPRWWGRDRKRYAHALHLVLAGTGGGGFRSTTGRHYIQGVAYRERVFTVQGRSRHPSEGAIIFTQNIADALQDRYGSVGHEELQRRIGDAIAHEIGHLLGYPHAARGFMSPQLSF